jgi:hypothetical protein
MNRAAREIALQALRNYLAGDLELTATEVGEVLTVALARALALAVAAGRMTDADVDGLLKAVRLIAFDDSAGAIANSNGLHWSE